MREATAIQIMQIIAGVGLMGLGVVGIILVGQGRGDADEHDLADYRRPAARHTQPAPRQLVDVDTRATALDAAPVVEQPVPWRPPYAELTVAAVVRRYGDSPADIAARWLREAGEQARAGLAAAR